MPCRAIKKIASSFNLTNELTVSLNGLVVEAKQLKSTQARENADRAIEELKAFISQLSEETPGVAHRSASSYTAEPVLPQHTNMPQHTDMQIERERRALSPKSNPVAVCL